MDQPTPPRFWDYAVVVLYGLLLFGYSGFGGRPLTMHEARLPETSREMIESGEWLLPRSGIRPWLERPPLPHWVVMGSMKLFHRSDTEWVVRLPSALMGIGVLCLTVWMAGRWFGKATGLLAGLVLASCFEFYQYSSLAEDDIYLAALVGICIGLLARAEFVSGTTVIDRRRHFLGNRPWEIWAFFIVLGLTNLTKGPLLGILIVGSTLGIYLLWEALVEKNARGLLRYTWLWGWILMIGLSLAWPAWAYHKYPDVLQNWKYDYLGRMSGSYSDINQSWYYYPPQLAARLAPWTPLCLFGLIWAVLELSNRNRGWLADISSTPDLATSQRRALRFVLCWAIAPLIILSIPKGKHHHYLVPFLAPWAILGAISLRQGWKALNFQPRRGAIAMGITMGVLLIGYCAGLTLLAAQTDQTVFDTQFLKRARSEVPPDAPLFINAKLGNTGNLDFFRIQFYSRPDAALLHNLTYLRDEKITAPQVYVITRFRDQERLAQLGTVIVIDQSQRSHEIPGPAGRFTLFKLTFDPNLKRYPAPQIITTMQAMERDLSGPWCGPPFQ